MPNKRKYERIHCKHFLWTLFQRDGVWYADGRLNEPDAGRHSLNTRDDKQAVKDIHEMDAQVAADLGLAP